MWPILGACLMTYFNVDFIIIPFLRYKGFSNLGTFLISVPIAEIEMVGWYYFWIWIIKRRSEVINIYTEQRRYNCLARYNLQ